MAQKKFLFDTYFEKAGHPPGGPADSAAGRGSGLPGVADPTAPSPAIYGEEDLAAAREDAYRQGHAAGSQEAAQASETAAAQALDAVMERITALMARWSELEDAGRRESLHLALILVAKMFPALAEREGLPEIEKVLADCLARMREEPRLVVRVPGLVIDRLRERFEELTERAAFEGKLVLLEDPTAGPSDVLVEWPDGGAERNLERQWHEMEKILSHSLHQPGQAVGQ